METAILARHGESEHSLRGLTNGDPRVAVRLTERGRAQARALGAELEETSIDLCVVSQFLRARETAELALAARDVPFHVLPELNDIGFGEFEGRLLADYRAWARAHGPLEEPPGGGESRAETVARYARAFRLVLSRPERTVLVVAHSLPIRYVLQAAEALPPAPAVEQVPYAEAFALRAARLTEAVDLLEAWVREPAWQS